MFSDYLLHLCIRCRFKVIHTNKEMLGVINHRNARKCENCKRSWTTHEYTIREWHKETNKGEHDETHTAA